MPRYDLAALKNAQDADDERKQNLLDAMLPFRKGVLVGLRRFTEEAAQRGLRGVQPCEVSAASPDLVTTTFSLNGFDLLLVSTRDVVQISAGQEELALRLLIYRNGVQESEPLVDILVREYARNLTGFEVRYFSEHGTGYLAMGDAATEDNGREEVVGALIDYFYGFKYHWKQRPTMADMLSRRNHQTTVGFYTKNA